MSGKLLLPGTPAPDALITLLLPTRGGLPRAVPVLVKGGVFYARFEGKSLRSGTLEARFAGSEAYEPITIQVQIASSTARVSGNHALHLSSATTRR